MLVIQSEWQRQMMREYGNDRALLVDATFGTNKYKFALTTGMVLTGTGEGIPVFWVIHSSSTEAVLKMALDEVAKRMDRDGEYKPSVVIIDDCQAEINAVKNGVWCANA